MPTLYQRLIELSYVDVQQAKQVYKKEIIDCLKNLPVIGKYI